MEKRHLTKKWEASFTEFMNSVGKIYKITRKIPELSVSEIKTFRSKEKAMLQFEEWLH